MKHMKLRRLILILTFACTAIPILGQLSYKNPNLPVETRVQDLMARMTLEEKIAQMCQYVGIEHIKSAEKRLSARQLQNNDAAGFYPGLSSADIEQMTAEGKIGSFLHVVTVEEANALQKLALKSRLGIPLIIGIDAIHGVAMVNGATVFPSPIGLASSFDLDLVERVARQTAVEMRATGSHWTFSPNLDVSRDARWGRVGETFGEDPFLAGEMGVAMVKGYQGKDFSGPTDVIACAKHLIAGSEPVNGLNAAPMDVSERTLREIFLPPYQAAIDAGVYTVMTAHNEINGVPCHASHYLMETLVREEYGFKGFIVSDWMDIERLATLHRVAQDQKEAVYQTVDAGMDMHMHGPGFLSPLAELVREDRISEKRIDESAKRILTAKFTLGLFEDPLVDENKAEKIVFNSDHQQLALEAARKSIVLLKNDGILPIDRSRVQKILVTGPNAHNHTVLGDWVLQQPEDNVITVLEGLRRIAPDEVQIEYFDCGSSIKALAEDKIKKAGELAASADLSIVVVGENSLRYEGGEKTSGENVDRSSIQLAGQQLDLVQSIHASGKPTAVVMINSRPLGVEWIAENIPALVEAWEPGCKAGEALAEVLFGRVNPSGKLPISFPRNAGHIQTIYNHKPSQYFHKYVIGQTGPLFDFGHGLSYTTFEYKNLSIPEEASPGLPIKITVDLSNIGDRQGTEVVLLYVNDVVSSVTTPVKELKAFQRVQLEAGQTTTVEFVLDYNTIALYNVNMHKVVEPGLFEVFLGDQKGEFRVTE